MRNDIYPSPEQESLKKVSALLLVLLGLPVCIPISAGELSGYLGVESRVFLAEGLYAGQSDGSVSAAANIEYYRDWDDFRQRLVVTGFARAGSGERERSHADLREFYWWRDFNNVELYVGARHLFWGVTETVHLVDVINQDDRVENLDGEDKLGQPMISLLMERDWGTLEVFGLLGFRNRTYPGRKGRLRGPVAVDESRATYQSGVGEKHIDLALRWSHVLGDWDLGVSHFSGTARDPLLRPVIASGELVALAPHYPQLEQTGLDLQATKEDWLWKLEAISVREKSAGRNTALVGGFEYSFVGIAGSYADLGVLLEYQFDDRRGARETASQNDLALGARLALNDVQSTELLAVVSVDRDWGSRFISLEGSRRLTDYWSLEGELRIFSNMDREDSIYGLRNDDYLQLELRRYF